MGEDDDAGLREENALLRAAMAAMTQAQTAMAAMVTAQARQPAQAPVSVVTVDEVADGYERSHVDVSSRMRKDKLAPLRRRLGKLPAIELTPKVWALHRGARRLEIMDYGRSKGKPPAWASLNVELGVAKGMLEWACDDEQELIPFNPLRRAKRVKTKKARKTWLREEDLQRLLAAPEPRGEEQRLAMLAFILVSADTGLRFSEVLNLRRDRLHEAEGGFVIDVDRTKGDKSHAVGLTPRCVDSVTAWFAFATPLRSPYLFTRPVTQRRYGKRTVYGWFRSACRTSGIDDIVVDGEIRVRPHDLRRSAATNVVHRGGTIQDAQVMLNHSNIATTALYVQRPEKDAVRLAQIMADGITPKKDRKGPQAAPGDVTAEQASTYR